jgi:enoyl-CoA hydratase/carnithine racemase
VSGLHVERDGPVTRLVLDRPDRANALDDSLVEALLAAVAGAEHDGTRLLVLHSGVKNFSAGFDFSAIEATTEGELLRRFVRIEQLLEAIWHAPFATMSLAHGRNFGAGVDLFVACDVRVAAPGTTFRMPGLRFGLQLGTRRLAQRIGNDVTRALLADSSTIDARRAHELGFVTHLQEVPDWPGLLTAERERAEALTADAARRLRAATVVDTRASDMADLVASVTLPGLKARITTYRSNA